jgi:hypothetical protein
VRRPCCSDCNGKCHLKDWRGHHIATLFGAVTVPLPRFRCTACHRIETSVGWPSHCRSTPNLDQLQAHVSALMTYRVASGVLQHLLPIDAGRSPETLRNHTLRIGARIGSTTSDEPTTAAAVITVSVDSTFIRSREEGERHLEVRVGNVETASGGRRVLGAVAKADTDISALIRQSIRAVGRTDDTKVTAFTDGCLGLRSDLVDAGSRRHPSSIGSTSQCGKRVVDRRFRPDAGKVRDRRRGRTAALAHLERQGEECQAQHRSSPQGHACL